MKRILFATMIALTLVGCAKTEDAQAADTQTVCIDKIGKDGKIVLDKDGKPQQDCKKMKVHKKLDGTKIPEKAK